MSTIKKGNKPIDGLWLFSVLYFIFYAYLRIHAIALFAIAFVKG